jgi:hypothetical protein
LLGGDFLPLDRVLDVCNRGFLQMKASCSGGISQRAGKRRGNEKRQARRMLRLRV